MIEVRYSKAKMWMTLGVLVPFTLAVLWVGSYVKKAWLFSPMTLGVAGIIFIVAAIRIALSDGIAFQAAREGLTISGVWFKRRIAWADLRDVKLIRETVRRKGEAKGGAITDYLVFEMATTKDIRLDYDKFDLPLAEGFALVEQLRRMRQDAVPSILGGPIKALDGRDVLEGATLSFGRKLGR